MRGTHQGLLKIATDVNPLLLQIATGENQPGDRTAERVGERTRRERKTRRTRVDLVHLVYPVQPNKRDRPDKQERPADPRACRAPFRHFAKNRHEQSGLVSQSASETRGKGMCLRSFLPIDLYKSTRRERLNLYRSVLTPAHGPPGPCVMMRLSLMKILSQRGIPLLLG